MAPLARSYRTLFFSFCLLPVSAVAASRPPLLYDRVQQVPAHAGETLHADLYRQNLVVHVVPGSSEIRVRTRIWASADAGEREKIVHRYVPTLAAGNETLKIESRQRNLWDWHFWPFAKRDVLSRVTLYVPEGERLDCNLGSGDMRFDNPGDRADIKASLGSGSLFVNARPQRLRVEDGSGDIRVRTAQGAGTVKLQDGSGNVDLRGAVDDLRVETGSGNIAIDGRSTRSAVIQAGAGNVKAHWTGLPGGASLRAETGAGNLAMYFPAATPLAGKASVGVGSLRSDFPVTLRGGVYRLSGGVGAVHVDLASGVGEVSLRKSGG